LSRCIARTLDQPIPWDEKELLSTETELLSAIADLRRRLVLVYRRQNALAPIGRLPEEILLRIFELYTLRRLPIPGTYDHDLGLVADWLPESCDPMRTLTLSHVSSAWRQITHGASFLWANPLLVESGQPEEAVVAPVELMRQASCTLMGLPEERELAISPLLARALKTSPNTVKHLLCATQLSEREKFTISMPALESIFLDCCGSLEEWPSSNSESDDFPPIDVPLPSSAPRLHTMALVDFPVPFRSPLLGNLSRLSLCGSYGNTADLRRVLTVVEQAPLLTELLVTFYYRGDGFDYGQFLHEPLRDTLPPMPHLKKLVLVGDYIASATFLQHFLPQPLALTLKQSEHVRPDLPELESLAHFIRGHPFTSHETITPKRAAIACGYAPSMLFVHLLASREQDEAAFTFGLPDRAGLASLNRDILPKLLQAADWTHLRHVHLAIWATPLLQIALQALQDAPALETLRLTRSVIFPLLDALLPGVTLDGAVPYSSVRTLVLHRPDLGVQAGRSRASIFPRGTRALDALARVLDVRRERGSSLHAIVLEDCQGDVVTEEDIHAAFREVPEVRLAHGAAMMDIDDIFVEWEPRDEDPDADEEESEAGSSTHPVGPDTNEEEREAGSSTHPVEPDTDEEESEAGSSTHQEEPDLIDL
jgi:hypothetical protein